MGDAAPLQTGETGKRTIFYIFEIKHNSFMNFLSKFVSFLKVIGLK